MTENSNGGSERDLEGLLLPEEGIVDLSDKLMGYMAEIELGGLSDIMGQVLDDFLEQCGGMPEDLNQPDSFDQITRNQVAITLAYQLGRLEGRSPQVVGLLIQQCIDSWGTSQVPESANISEADFEHPKQLVYPRLRRLEYTEPEHWEE